MQEDNGRDLTEVAELLDNSEASVGPAADTVVDSGTMSELSESPIKPTKAYVAPTVATSSAVNTALAVSSGAATGVTVGAVAGAVFAAPAGATAAIGLMGGAVSGAGIAALVSAGMFGTGHHESPKTSK